MPTIAEKFNDICLLHLSDLHIVCKAKNSYGNQLRKLIDDIHNQTNNIEKILLVVSGDIIDKGDYCEANIAVAIKFFKDLYAKLGNKIIDLIMTPGNHDKHRNSLNELISLGVRFKDGLVKDDEWKYIRETYSGYIGLYNTLLKTFYDKENCIKNTFGVHKVELNNQVILFIRLDSAWSSFSTDDSYKLSFGEYQRNRLVEEYQSAREELKEKYEDKDIITIGISHFPINLLKSEDEEACNKLFLSERGLDLDLLLCGHVHNASLSHYFNHEHSLLTLVTGIGSSDENSSQEEHRYSIYILNLNNNSCDIIVRKSVGNNYTYDYSLYTMKKNIDGNKLVYPIRVSDSHAFINLYSPNMQESKSVFLDNDTLKLIPKISMSLNKFVQVVMSAPMTAYKSDACQSVRDKLKNCKQFDEDVKNKIYTALYDSLFKGDVLPDEIKEYLSSVGMDDLSSVGIMNYFYSYLSEVCNLFNKYLIDLFSENIIIRSHFRIYDSEQQLYTPIQCQITKHRNQNKFPNKAPKNVPWTRMMQSAFKNDDMHTIQFSANPRLNDVDTDWDDFLTVIPMCFGNDVEFKFGEKDNYKYEHRPCITFGISIKNAKEEDVRLLSILSFLRLDEILKNIIDEFINSFNMELKKSLKKLSNLDSVSLKAV